MAIREIDPRWVAEYLQTLKANGLPSSSTVSQWESGAGFTVSEILQRDGSVALTGALPLMSYDVAGAPAAGTAGRLIYVSDGDAGSPCLAVDNGSSWLVVSLGAAISAT